MWPELPGHIFILCLPLDEMPEMVALHAVHDGDDGVFFRVRVGALAHPARSAALEVFRDILLDFLFMRRDDQVIFRLVDAGDQSVDH